MKIDKQTLQKIAHLARLEFEEESAEAMMADLSKILDWVEQLNEVDTEGVEPLTHMSVEVNVLREDLSQEPLSRERGLKNAPEKDQDYFRVPKVLE
ncbi:Asp-tRNA(Asn)/Glu-tRNA(Gln) amidotransferase subunit GatC [Cesiribacter sp. SM1]|uniref:Asp-tRNA(Asn)/Glu-tRNA(Gln) amidotransferase subunit GatC n=1 Tax=Cesiribacter sp. SM1 TaxID=2861196 RepID=UPI001CD7E207|nr:Asp-tRNA(Asn)/Glu-tRNA(Gln) amidotransferase subunit GatC [Cesiribacter sp. SM1]